VSYSNSHTYTDAGRQYDLGISGDYYSFVWEDLEQPLLQELIDKGTLEGSGPVLDFACGTGRVTEFLVKRFKVVVGLDVSREMLAQAKRNVPCAKFVLADVTRNRPSVLRYRLITAFRFFQNAEPHLREQVLAWIGRKLTPEGIAVLNIHANPTSPYGFYQAIRRSLRVNAHRATSVNDLFGALPGELSVELMLPYGYWPRFGYFGPWCRVFAKGFEMILTKCPMAWRRRFAQHILIVVRKKGRNAY